MTDAADRKRPRTPRHIIRWAGSTAIVLALLMALVGAYGYSPKASIRAFYLYWSAFFLFLMSAVACAMLDTLMTIIKFRKEHKEMREAFRQAISGDKEGDARE